MFPNFIGQDCSPIYSRRRIIVYYFLTWPNIEICYLAGLFLKIKPVKDVCATLKKKKTWLFSNGRPFAFSKTAFPTVKKCDFQICRLSFFSQKKAFFL